MCCTSNTPRSDSFSICKRINDDHDDDYADKEWDCYHGRGPLPGSTCKFVPCSEVGHCTDAPPTTLMESLSANVGEVFEYESGQRRSLQDDADDAEEPTRRNGQTPRTPRPVRTPRPARTRAPRPPRTSRPTDHPTTARPTGMPTTPLPTSVRLRGCEGITDQQQCEGINRLNCVWNDGYPDLTRINLERAEYKFGGDQWYNVNGGDESVNLMIMCLVLVAVSMYGYRKCFAQGKNNAKVASNEDSPLNVREYGSCQA